MTDYQTVKDLLADTFSLCEKLRRFLNDSSEPHDYAITEAVAEAVADAVGMTAVTDDDLPKTEEHIL